MSRISRTLFIVAVAVLLIGIVVSVATDGRQFYPALVVAIVLAAAGFVFTGRSR